MRNSSTDLKRSEYFRILFFFYHFPCFFHYKRHFKLWPLYEVVLIAVLVSDLLKHLTAYVCSQFSSRLLRHRCFLICPSQLIPTQDKVRPPPYPYQQCLCFWHKYYSTWVNLHVLCMHLKKTALEPLSIGERFAQTLERWAYRAQQQNNLYQHLYSLMKYK